VKSTSIYKSIAGEQEVMRLYESALARWPVPCDRLNIATRQGNTFAIASGNAEAPEDASIANRGATGCLDSFTESR
jgi:hypothetical protein